MNRFILAALLTAGTFGHLALTAGDLDTPPAPAPSERVQQIRQLQKEYTETGLQIKQARQHQLRLEGAIAILQQMENQQTTATDSLTTGT